MKRTIYLPDELDTHIERYLQEHPEETVSSFVQTAIKDKLAISRPTDYDALLSLAGIVKDGPTQQSERPEDEVMRHIRDSRDI